MKFFLLQKAGLILKKGAFFEIFKPIIWAQLCAYGNCPCIKGLLNDGINFGQCNPPNFWIGEWSGLNTVIASS